MDAVSKTAVGDPIGQVGRVAGVRGKALDLSDGKSSFALNGLTTTTATRGKSLTVSVWFKSDAPEGSVFFAGAKPKNAAAPFPHLAFVLLPKSNVWGDRGAATLRWQPEGKAKATEAVVYGPQSLTAGWTHLAFTRDGATGQGTFYVDGIPIHARRGDGSIGTVGGPDAILGGLVATSRSDSTSPDRKERRSFAGLIDEFAIFDTPLSEDDVRKLAGR
jgi:hypothetical protein